MAILLTFRESFDIDNLRRTGGPLKTSTWCSNQFDWSSTCLLIDLWEQDVEGIDLFLCENNGYEAYPDEDIGEFRIHTFGANL